MNKRRYFICSYILSQFFTSTEGYFSLFVRTEESFSIQTTNRLTEIQHRQSVAKLISLTKI